MDDAVMHRAAELIRSGQYEEARYLLQQVDNPTAREWLAEIDRRLGISAPHQGFQTPRPRIRLRSGCIIAVLIFCGLLFIAGALNPTDRNSSPRTNTRVPTVAVEVPTIELLPTRRPVTTSTRRPAPSATPPPTETLAPIYSEAQYVRDLGNGLSLLAGGRNVDSVRVADGRAAGGERGAIISYLTTESTEVGQVDEIIDLFQAVAATIRANDLDLDSVTLVAGTAAAEATGTFTTSVQDLLAFSNGSITRSTFLNRLSVVAF